MEEIDEDQSIIVTSTVAITNNDSAAGIESEDGANIEEKDAAVLEGGGVAGNNARGDEGVLEGVAIGDVVDDANVSDSDEDDNGFIIHAGRSTTAPRRSTLPRGSNVYIRPQAPTTGSGGMTIYGDVDADTEEAIHQGQNKDEIKRLRFSHHRTAFDVDIESLETHPWRLRNVDLSDYFNYGFTEAQWIQYSEKQLQVRAKVGLGPYIHKPAVITATNLPRTEPPSSSSSSSSMGALGTSLPTTAGSDAASSAVVGNTNMAVVQFTTSNVTAAVTVPAPIPTAPPSTMLPLPSSTVPVVVPALPLPLLSGQQSQPQQPPPQQHPQHAGMGGMMGGGGSMGFPGQGQGQGLPMHGGHGPAGWNMQQQMQQMQGMMGAGGGGGGGGWVDPRMQQGGYHMMGHQQQHHHQHHHHQQHQQQRHQHGGPGGGGPGGGGGGGFPGMGGPMGGNMPHGQQQGFGPGGGPSSYGREQGGYPHQREGGGPSRGGDVMRDGGGPRDMMGSPGPGPGPGQGQGRDAHRSSDSRERDGGRIDGRKRDRDMVKDERDFPVDKRSRGGDHIPSRPDQQQHQHVDHRGGDGRGGGGGGGGRR